MERYVCSHRARWAKRLFQWRKRWSCAGVRWESVDFPAALLGNFVVVKGSRRNLYAARKLKLFWSAIEIHFLTHDLICAVLSCGLNQHRVRAGLYRFSEVIFPVPSKCVLSRGTGGARNRIHNVRIHAHGSRVLVAAPGMEFSQILVFREPESNRADRSMIFVLDPHRDIGAFRAETLNYTQFYCYGQFISAVPKKSARLRGNCVEYCRRSRRNLLRRCRCRERTPSAARYGFAVLFHQHI